MDNTVCRIVNVAHPRRYEVTVHQVLTEYLAEHSPVPPPSRAELLRQTLRPIFCLKSRSDPGIPQL